MSSYDDEAEIRRFEKCHYDVTTLLVSASGGPNHKQLHKLSYESHRTSVKYSRAADKMATSYRRTMSRRTFIVRHAFLCHTTLRTTKMHCRTTKFDGKVRQISYDRMTACGDFIVLMY